jgi:hypothetical protein
MRFYFTMVAVLAAGLIGGGIGYVLRTREITRLEEEIAKLERRTAYNESVARGALDGAWNQGQEYQALEKTLEACRAKLARGRH